MNNEKPDTSVPAGLYRAEYHLIPNGRGFRSNGGLSEREWEIMLAICRGEPPGATAQRLGLSTKTISTYRARVLKKTGARGNVQLALMAFRQGLVK